MVIGNERVEKKGHQASGAAGVSWAVNERVRNANAGEPLQQQALRTGIFQLPRTDDQPDKFSHLHRAEAAVRSLADDLCGLQQRADTIVEGLLVGREGVERAEIH